MNLVVSSTSCPNPRAGRRNSQILSSRQHCSNLCARIHKSCRLVNIAQICAPEFTNLVVSSTFCPNPRAGCHRYSVLDNKSDPNKNQSPCKKKWRFIRLHIMTAVMILSKKSVLPLLFCSLIVLSPDAKANLKSRVQGIVRAVSVRKVPLSQEAASKACAPGEVVRQSFVQTHDERYFNINGDAYTKAATWYDVLRPEFDEWTQLGEGNRRQDVILGKDRLGGYDFFHAFNLVYGPQKTPTVDPIIVDGTYLQYFSYGGYPQGLEPIFVGTQRELIELVKKHSGHVKLNHMQNPLDPSDAARFVETMWPVWTHM